MPLANLNEQEPGWKLLEVVMKERYPDREYADILRAIQEYRFFLEFKQEHNDYDSKIFSPSVAIDEVWHAHLSFLDRYQKDIQAMTKTHKIFEHNPVPASEAAKRYKAAREAHVARMQRLEKTVRESFWPDIELPPETHDGDSDNGLYVPQIPQCG